MGEMERRETVTLTVPVSGSATGNVYLGSNLVLCGLLLPATLETGTLRAVIKGYFSRGGATDGTPAAIKDYAGATIDESLVVVAATNTNLHVYLSADQWESVNVIEITFTAADGTTPVVQTTARTITAIVRPY